MTERDWRVEDADGAGDFLWAARTAVHSHNPALRLSAVAVVKERIADIEEDAVEHAVSAGMAWVTIAERLGVRRQTVHAKYAGPEPAGRRRRSGRWRVLLGIAEARERAYLEAWTTERQERLRREAAGEGPGPAA